MSPREMDQDTPPRTDTTITVADPEVDLFAGMKKKKKKQVALDLGDSVPAEEHAEKAAPAPEEESAAPPPAAIETPATGDDSGAAEPAAAAGDAPAEDGGDLFADLKKKKKKKKDIPLDLVRPLIMSNLMYVRVADSSFRTPPMDPLPHHLPRPMDWTCPSRRKSRRSRPPTLRGSWMSWMPSKTRRTRQTRCPPTTMPSRARMAKRSMRGSPRAEVRHIPRYVLVSCSVSQLWGKFCLTVADMCYISCYAAFSRCCTNTTPSWRARSVDS